MKSSKFILISAVLLIFFCSLNFISAIELDNTTMALPNENEVIDLVVDEKLLAEDVNSDLMGDNVDESSDEGYIIYVGQNSEEGNGTFENPFKNFTLACNNVTGQDKVTLRILSGEYFFGGMYYFNTTDLNIEGIGGNVIIKTQFTDKITKERQIKTPMGEGFGLINDQGKFSIENIIFDSTGRTYEAYIDDSKTYFFDPFHVHGNMFQQSDIPTWDVDIVGIFKNCTFIADLTLLRGFEFNCSFDKCNFVYNYEHLFLGSLVNNTNHVFNYCSFDFLGTRLASFYYWPFELRMDNCWFGQNKLPRYISNFASYTYNTTGIDSSWDHIANPIQLVSNYTVPISRYAVFNVTYSYLGNNQYEILGKLTWNGTEDQDGMENFQPMTVKLESEDGHYKTTATLVNGNFKTIYTSSNPNNKLTATLHNQEIPLEFNTVNITADPVNIYYGNDQNITFNFTQLITANVTVTVSNGSYSKSERVEVIGKDSFVYTVPDTLKAGTYDVEINLADNNYYGFNTTTLTVSKKDVDLEVTTGDVNFGETATVNITLPADVTGTVVIKFGNDTKELNASQTMTVPFTNLNVTEKGYSVNVSYKGNDKYLPKDHPTVFVYVNPAKSGLEIEDATFTYGEPISIPFNMTNAEGVNVIVYNEDDDEVANASSESGIINLDTLPAGKYSLDVETIVGSNYESVPKTIDLTINKANSSLDISDKEFAYAAEAVINAVTKNSTGNVNATLTDENNTEIAIKVSGDNITLPKLNTGKYTLTVTTNPDENHNNVTKSVTITITKTTPSMNVVVKPAVNITAKDDVTLTISLPSDATGEVTVKVNGKKLDQVSANETITIDLNNKVGDYVVDIAYSGDKNYESDNATKEFKISKAEILITAEQIDFEEGNASKIEVTVPNVDSGIVLVDVAGKKFYGDIDSGNAIVIIEGVDAGNYTANVKFFGDDKYKEATTAANVKVSEAKIITELKEQLVDAQNNASQLKDELDNVSGQLVDAQNNASQLKDELDNVSGQLVDAKDNATDLAGQLDVAKANATKLAEDLADANSKVENLTTQLDKAQSNVTVVVDGVEYPVDVINGTVTIKTNSTKPIAKKDTVIVVDNAFTRVANDYNAGERGGMFYVTLRDIDGNVLVNKTVQIALNGKIYNNATDDEGRAGLQVNLANAGTYTYAISFQGDDQYNAAPMASSKLTVSKKKTTIKASNKVFNAKKTKKISVTLKTVKNQYDNKTYLKSGKKVILKVNGKTYTKYTNKKGVVKFTIKLTKKGKYAAKIKFAGDKTYKASSKTIKIRIK